MRHLSVFVHFTSQTKYLIRVRSLTKRTNINELLAERFTNCSSNVRFIYRHSWSLILEQICSGLRKRFSYPGGNFTKNFRIFFPLVYNIGF
ncbi:hypothetical protein Hanom_Chr00s032266g01770481 [Helianthus anomalus]